MRGLWWGVGPWFWGPSWWPWGSLVMVGFWVAVIVVLAVLFRRLGWPTSGRSDSALEILRSRYARGELSREDFETMRRDLVAR